MSRVRLFMVIVVVVLGLVSCGGDADRALTVPGPTASAPSNGDGDGPPGAPSTADAQAALLTLDDLPAGWTVDPEESDGLFGSGERGSGKTPDGAKSGECTQIARELNDQEPVVEAARAFTAGGSGPHVEHSVNFFNQDTAPLVERLATVLGGCPEALENESPSFDYRMQPLSFPNLGDRTAAVRLVARSGSTSMTFDFVVVGRAMSMLFAGGFDTLDGSELERLARLSVDRMS